MMRGLRGLVIAAGCGLLLTAACGSTSESSNPASGGAVSGATGESGGAAQAGKANSGGSSSVAGASAGSAPMNGGAAGVAGLGGSSSGGSSAGSAPVSSAELSALYAQAPHCLVAAGFAFHLQGTVDGAAVQDDRTTGLNAGFEIRKFTTPAGDVPLPPAQVKLSFEVSQTLNYGEGAAIITGQIVPPVGHPRAGQPLCITDGIAGLPSDRAEGALKFWIRGARSGADCSGPVVQIDLRGCMY